jgi:hypothetical protein
MKEEIITFTTAKLAKEKRFITDVEGMSWIGTCYNKEGRLDDDFFDENGKELNTYFKYLAPTQSLLQKWLREVHNLWVEPSINTYPKTNNVAVSIHYFIDKEITKTYNPYELENLTHSDTFEEALEKGLQEALTLIKI